MGPSASRLCARIGCGQPVKKPTNKYCSRACCIIDPTRIEKLRAAGHRRVLPLARQLDLGVWGPDESVLVGDCEELEEAPAGLSRLTAS